MLALDRSELDRALLEYTFKMAAVLEPQHISIIHIFPDFEASDKLRKELGIDGLAPDELLRKEIRNELEEFMPEGFEDRIDLIVVEGKLEKQLNHWAKVREMDLLILGRKAHREGGGLVPRRVARNVACDVLFVPPVDFSLKRLVVPVDYSKASLNATYAAMAIRKANEDSDIELYNSCYMPSHMFYESMAGRDLVDMLKESSWEEMDEFAKKAGLENYLHRIDSDRHRKASAKITAVMREQEADLVIMGAKGKTALQGMILGSVTEGVCHDLHDIPLLIVKKDWADHSDDEASVQLEKEGA